jgi:hypothetical protein
MNIVVMIRRQAVGAALAQCVTPIAIAMNGIKRPTIALVAAYIATRGAVRPRTNVLALRNSATL